MVQPNSAGPKDWSIDQIGFQPGPLQVYRNLLVKPFGIILVSGPTGSGKTATLHASLSELRRREQSVAHMDTDITVVDEIRDAETAKAAVQAVLAGHLVLASICANDAAVAVIQLINLRTDPRLVTSIVIGSVAQRLVRKICPHCQTIVTVPVSEAMAYQQEMQEVRADFYVGQGCGSCSHTGYFGKTGVFEVMPVSGLLRQLIGRGATPSELRQQAMREGMISLRWDGMLKAKDGVTTPGEIISRTFSPS